MNRQNVIDAEVRSFFNRWRDGPGKNTWLIFLDDRKDFSEIKLEMEKCRKRSFNPEELEQLRRIISQELTYHFFRVN